jgi:hypothetical protein
MSSYWTRGDFTKNCRTTSEYLTDKRIKRSENSVFVSTHKINPNATSSYISKNFAKSVSNLRYDRTRYVYTRSS